MSDDEWDACPVCGGPMKDWQAAGTGGAEATGYINTPVRLVEVHGESGDAQFTDLIIVEEGVREADVITGTAPIICQVGSREIGAELVAAVNGRAHDAESLRLAREVISDMVRHGIITVAPSDGYGQYCVGENVIPTIMGVSSHD